MIENDIYVYLSTDTTLQTLLSGTAADTKIYPRSGLQIPTKPYITYSNSAGIDDINTKNDRIDFNIVAENKDTANTIRDRIMVLLDKEDLVQNTITSTSFIFVYSIKVYGDGLIDQTTNDYIEILAFEIKYLEK